MTNFERTSQNVDKRRWNSEICNETKLTSASLNVLGRLLKALGTPRSFGFGPRRSRNSSTAQSMCCSSVLGSLSLWCSSSHSTRLSHSSLLSRLSWSYGHHFFRKVKFRGWAHTAPLEQPCNRWIYRKQISRRTLGGDGESIPGIFVIKARRKKYTRRLLVNLGGLGPKRVCLSTPNDNFRIVFPESPYIFPYRFSPVDWNDDFTKVEQLRLSWFSGFAKCLRLSPDLHKPPCCSSSAKQPFKFVLRYSTPTFFRQWTAIRIPKHNDTNFRKTKSSSSHYLTIHL